MVWHFYAQNMRGLWYQVVREPYTSEEVIRDITQRSENYRFWPGSHLGQIAIVMRHKERTGLHFKWVLEGESNGSA
jgi:hypothetical protein